MPFIIENDVVVSFADFQDCVDKDQRLFESNEGISDDTVEQHLTRATEKILDKFRATGWWRDYYAKMSGSGYINPTDIPAIDPSKIKDRQNDFTDLCIYVALADYILPSIADFGREDSSERQKMAYYTQRASDLFAELLTAGDWYDFDDDGTVGSNEKEMGIFNLKRVR